MEAAQGNPLCLSTDSGQISFFRTDNVQIADNSGSICQRIRISGIVQGVGFRPLVWRLAKELGLAGWVRNDARGVEIEVSGAPDKVQCFIRRLQQDAPPLTRIDTISSRFRESVSVSQDFFILDSRGGRAATMISQDTVVCRDCLREMFDPDGRRWRIPCALRIRTRASGLPPWPCSGHG